MGNAYEEALMERQVVAHEGIRDELKRIADSLKNLPRVLVQDVETEKVCVRVAQI